MGRKTKYQESFNERARILAEGGALDVDIAQALGCGLTTLYVWQAEYPKFRDSIKMAKDKADDRVEAALYNNAVHRNDTTAQIFILKNRRPAQWRDGFVHQHELPTMGEVKAALDGVEDEI